MTRSEVRNDNFCMGTRDFRMYFLSCSELDYTLRCCIYKRGLEPKSAAIQ
jgi:hypothetical protein